MTCRRSGLTTELTEAATVHPKAVRIIKINKRGNCGMHDVHHVVVSPPTCLLPVEL